MLPRHACLSVCSSLLVFLSVCSPPLLFVCCYCLTEQTLTPVNVKVLYKRHGRLRGYSRSCSAPRSHRRSCIEWHCHWVPEWQWKSLLVVVPNTKVRVSRSPLLSERRTSHSPTYFFTDKGRAVLSGECGMMQMEGGFAVF